MKDFIKGWSYQLLTLLVKSTVFYLMWGWFVTPFFGHQLSFAGAMGLVVLLSFVLFRRFSPAEMKRAKKEGLTTRFAHAIAHALVTLTLAGIVQLFI